MAGAAAFLIDLENFFIGRENLFKQAHPDELYEFPIDLDSLCKFAEAIAGDRRLAVRRAYANFSDRRAGAGERRWDYYLQPYPRYLMEQGIEPVQVFRFPGGSNKNAADMRLAMDATALMNGPGKFEQFILVTGDSDFIPLAIELKRAGAEVAVIGVTGCTKPVFEKYCDRFEYFEDLLAARDVEAAASPEIQRVADALRALLAQSSPIRFAAIKPLLSSQLGQSFDPSRHDCETTGEFLRRHSRELGIVVRRGEHDWEITGAPVDAPTLAPGADPAPEPATRTPAPSPAPPADPDHSADAYREVLRQGVPRCYPLPYPDWLTITDAIWRVARPADAPPARVTHQELLNDATDACVERGVADASRKVRDATFILFKSGCFHLAEDGAAPGVSDFHWSKPATLDPKLDTLDALRRRAWTYLVKLLSRRLEQRGLPARPRTQPLADLLCGADANGASLENVASVVDGALLAEDAKHTKETRSAS